MFVFSISMFTLCIFYVCACPGRFIIFFFLFYFVFIALFSVGSFYLFAPFSVFSLLAHLYPFPLFPISVCSVVINRYHILYTVPSLLRPCPCHVMNACLPDLRILYPG